MDETRFAPRQRSLGDVQRTVRSQVFRGNLFVRLEHTLRRAAAFASELGDSRLINISHSSYGIPTVVVWYWE